MSYAAVQAVLERTLSDSAFRLRLFTQPTQALADYELTPDETRAFCHLSAEANQTNQTSQTRKTASERRQIQNAVPFWLTGGL